MGLSAAESNGRPPDTEELYREHGAAVAAFCRSLLRDGAEAEDATQQVFLSAHRALVNGSTPREPLRWLLAVARHECYARYCRRAGSPLPAGDLPEGATPDASVHVLRAGDLAIVWDEVGQMPTAQREAFLLREIRGLSYGQLAEELALSTSSVRSLLLRARARLRHRLRDAAASFAGVPWVQALVRAAGGDGTPPLSTATKAAAVGIGALALVGGGDVTPLTHHGFRTQADPRHAFRARVPRSATPVAAAVTPQEDRPQRDARRSEIEHARGRDDGSPKSGSDSSRSHERSGDGGTAVSDGSNDATAVTQTTTSGSDGGGISSSGPGQDGSSDGSSDHGSTTTSSGSDGGSDSTTTTPSGSDGSGSGGRDGPDG